MLLCIKKIIYRCNIPGFNDDTYEIMDDSHEKLIRNYIPESSSSLALSNRSNKENYTYHQIENCYVKIFIDPNMKNSMNETSSIINYGTNFTLKKCDTWVYSKEHYNITIVTEVYSI